jgi:site-specific recombinase XerD
MFETLFGTRPSVAARYRQGPLSDAREHFLKQCALQGYSQSMLKKIAWVQLSLAPHLKIDRGRLTAQDIEFAVNAHARLKGSLKSRTLFIHIATEWMRSLGCLEQSLPVESPYANQIAAFCQHLREERGLSQVTILGRCERLHWFFNSLQPYRKPLCKITVTDVDAFIEMMAKKGWKRSSLGCLAGSLRSFFHYAEAQGWCSCGLAAVIESPRIYFQERLTKGPSWQDVQRILDSSSGDRPADVRDHAILQLLAIYGLRRGEVARLRLEDIDWVGDRIIVSRSKQRRTQYYPLVPAAGKAIFRYLHKVRRRCEHRTLFLTLSAPVLPLSGTSISAVVRTRIRSLGISSASNGAHCLRHACAGHLLSAGFSLKQIGDYLGHRSANSTLSYTKIDFAGLRQVAEIDLGGLL